MKEHILNNFECTRCCGCLACVNVCPSNALYKAKDMYGFVIPGIDEDLCVHCGLCVSTCPYNVSKETYLPIVTYAALNNNDDSVKESSSGGIFSLLATAVIKQHGCVYGATMDENFQVKHISIEKISDLKKLQKSKYVQSDIGETYKHIKQKLLLGRKVLFTGTPCQVAGLRSFLKKEYNNLLCVDVVCHGVPSQELFDDYIACLSDKVGEITDYTFRAKKQAKNGMNWFFSYTVKEKKTVIKNWPEDSYNYMYMKSMIYRDSCYACAFATRDRMSDITLCDYWGWERYHLEDFTASSTVSGVVINSEKGKGYWSEISDKVIAYETDYDDLARHNKCLVCSSTMNFERNSILESWKKDGYKKLDSQFVKSHRKQIIKYRLLRLIPEKIRWKIIQVKVRNNK